MLYKTKFKLSVRRQLFILFFAGLFIRFLYFPSNIYFGFDQARDAFISQDILKGHLKLIGPTTSIPGLNHGALYYYIYAPIYFLFKGDPTFVSGFLRILNSVGIFLIYGIGSSLFGESVGLISAFLYIFSFEQSQYAIYFNHPAFGIVSILLFYLGLSKFFFKRQKKGFILAMLGLGFSLQFQFVLIYLIFFFIFLSFVYVKAFKKINARTILGGFVIFLPLVSSFVLAELKYHNLFNFFKDKQSLQVLPINFLNFYPKTISIFTTFVEYNFIANKYLASLVLVLFLVFFLFLIKKKELRSKLLLLLLWLCGSLIPYLSDQSPAPLFYYTLGGSLALLIFAAFLVNYLFRFKKPLALFFLMMIAVSNIFLITKINPRGPLPSINVQTGMLLKDEKKVIDFIYINSNKEEFSVNALTLPFSINTTWSYLFEWYGQSKYHRLPIWGGDVASGYHGNLQIISSRSALPKQNFLIIEPLRGIPEILKNNFLREEGYFSKIITEEKFGDFVVQKREKI